MADAARRVLIQLGRLCKQAEVSGPTPGQRFAPARPPNVEFLGAGITVPVESQRVRGTASIVGTWSADNRGELYLNGVRQDELHTPPPSGGPWGSDTHACDADDNQYLLAMHALHITSGFQPGANYLQFRVWNEELETGNPAGFRFAVTSATYEAETPEPSTVALWRCGLGGLVLLRRRKAS